MGLLGLIPSSVYGFLCALGPFLVLCGPDPSPPGRLLSAVLFHPAQGPDKNIYMNSRWGLPLSPSHSPCYDSVLRFRWRHMAEADALTISQQVGTGIAPGCPNTPRRLIGEEGSGLTFPSFFRL